MSCSPGNQTSIYEENGAAGHRSLTFSFLFVGHKLLIKATDITTSNLPFGLSIIELNQINETYNNSTFWHQ